LNLKQLKRLSKVAKKNSAEVLQYVVITPEHLIVTDGKVLFKEKHYSRNPPAETCYIKHDAVASLKGTMFIIRDGIGSTDKGTIEVKMKTDVQYPNCENLLKTVRKGERLHRVKLYGEVLKTLADSLDKEAKYEFQFPKDPGQPIIITGPVGVEILLCPLYK